MLSHPIKHLSVAVIFVVSVFSSSAQSLDSTRIKDFPRFKLIQGNLDSDGLPISGAKLCLLKPENVCYQMPSNPGHSAGSVMCDYGLDPRSELLPLSRGGSLVFFSAEYSGGGSGSLESLAILRYESSGQIINILPFVGITGQSERAMWTVPGASRFPILVTADFNGMNGETHFAKHFYTVTAYSFDARKDRYTKLFSYRTSKKYPGLDDTNQPHILSPERRKILRLLGVKADETNRPSP